METDDPQTKDALLDRIRAGRTDFDTVLLAVPPEAVNEPVFAGGWSVKDLVAHIAAYEQWTAAQIAAGAEGRRATDMELYGVEELPEDPEGWDLDRQNAAIQERYAALSYPDALAFAEESFNRLLSALTALPDDAVVRPGVQSWTEGQAVIDVVPRQTYQHYLQHLPPLRELAGITTI
jgi:uncharacterized protein (TIGR03083 family)